MKQETLEEFCNRELENFNGSNTRSTEFDLGFRTGAIIGLRFPKEISYSEEEVKQLLLKSLQHRILLDDIGIPDWFEQFKKK